MDRLLHSIIVFVGLCGVTAYAQDSLAERLRESERARVELVARLAPSVVCVYDENQRGGGSGVIIDPEGYGLTNYHVIAGMMETRRGYGGLSDGKLYDLDVLGIDPTGDVAMFKLKGDAPFPFVRLGDSDQVRIGDPAIAMGNPFVLSEDYTPSVTLGIVTGVHRYQWGEGNNLVYSDCIQVDTPINPGNSGGPLFNLRGEVIGINGRISVNTRGRFNVGFGYAIGSNQIRRFIPGLRAGMLTPHGTLQATVERTPEGLVFGAVRPGASADKAGLRTGDRLIELDGKQIETPNEFASLLGTYPADWALPVRVSRDGTMIDVVARLDRVPVRMESKFNADPELARKAIRHVMGRFQRATFTDRIAARPREWQWTFRREVFTGEGQPSGKSDVRFECALRGDSPIECTETTEGAKSRSRVEFTDGQASEETAGLRLEVAPERAMVWHALYVLHRRLLAPIDDLPMDTLAHVGGQAWRPGRVAREETGNGANRSDRKQSTLTEVIRWSIADFAECRFHFDMDTARLVGAEVVDKHTGHVVLLDFEDYRDAGGLLWPTTVLIRERDRIIRETWSDWVLHP